MIAWRLLYFDCSCRVTSVSLFCLFPFISYSGKIAFIVNGRCKCSDFMQIVHALEYHKWFNFFTFVNHVSNKSKAKMLFLRYLQWLHWITLLGSVFPSNVIVLIQDLWTYSGIMKERKITIIMFSDLLCIYPYTNSVASTFPFLMPAKYSSCTYSENLGILGMSYLFSPEVLNVLGK